MENPEKEPYDAVFPYSSYRKNQRGLIAEIYGSLESRKNVLLSAPNGTGKTVINLSASIPVALRHGLKIIYLCRTHTQNDRVIEELRKINRKIGNNTDDQKERSKNFIRPITGISIRGRKEMCLHRTVRKMGGSPRDIMNVCADLRKNRNCRYFENFIKNRKKISEDLEVKSGKAPNAQEIIEFCREKNYCPYFVAKDLFKTADLIVCNYQWIFNPSIRTSFTEGAEFDLPRALLIMDECHNLPAMLEEIDSVTLTEYTIKQAIKDLKFGKALQSMIDRVKCWQKIIEILKKNIGNVEETALEPSAVLKRFMKLGNFSNLMAVRNFMDELGEYGEAVYEEKISATGGGIDFIGAVVRFMDKFLKTINDKRYFLTAVVGRRFNEKTLSIEIVCMDPRPLAEEVYGECFATVSCSGTIYPDAFIKLLGLDRSGKEIKKLEVKSPFPPENIKVLAVKGITTRAAERNNKTYTRLVAIIGEAVAATPKNVGIFCASYEVLKGLLTNGLKELVAFTGKKLFIEDSEATASDNAVMISKFKAISAGKGGVLLGVSGGRNSEGEDFPGDYMNTSIIVGFPFPRPTPRVKAKIEYYNEIFNNKGRLYGYIIPAVQRSNQACGRPIRKLDDKGAILLLDERFIGMQKLLSPWIRENMEVIDDKPNVIGLHLRQFFGT